MFQGVSVNSFVPLFTAPFFRVFVGFAIPLSSKV